MHALRRPLLRAFAALLALSLLAPASFADTVRRDAHGRIARSAKARRDFKKLHPCPATGLATGACPGWVIDHIIALKRGGADAPSNMQWQTVEAAKSKDLTE